MPMASAQVGLVGGWRQQTVRRHLGTFSKATSLPRNPQHRVKRRPLRWQQTVHRHLGTFSKVRGLPRNRYRRMKRGLHWLLPKGRSELHLATIPWSDMTELPSQVWLRADRRIKAGDVVLAIDGHYLYTGQEMNDETLRHKPGTKMTIRYRRYTATYEASVVMGTAQQPTPIATPTAPSPTHPVAAVAGFGQGQDKPSESAPPSDGVFYKTQTGWQQLEVLTSAGQNIHVNMLTMHGGGDQLYRGAEAPIQVSDRRPVFYIKVTPAEALMAEAGGPNAARNAVIVILSKKKDHRELRSVKTGLAGVKSGIDKRLLPDITVHSINNLMFTITP